MAPKLVIKKGKAFVPCLIDLGNGPAEYLLPADQAMKEFDAPRHDGVYEFRGLTVEPSQMTLVVKTGDQIEGNLCRIPEGEPGGGQWTACDGGGGGGGGGGNKPKEEKPAEGKKPDTPDKPGEAKQTTDPKTPAKKTFGERMKEAASAVKSGGGKAAAAAKKAGTTVKAAVGKAKEVHDNVLTGAIVKIESKLPEKWQGEASKAILENTTAEATHGWNLSSFLAEAAFSGAGSLMSYPVTWALAKIALLGKRAIKAGVATAGRVIANRRKPGGEGGTIRPTTAHEESKSFRYFSVWRKAYTPEEEAFFENAGQALHEAATEICEKLGIDRKVPSPGEFAAQFQKLWEERDEGAVVLPDDVDLGPDEDELDSGVGAAASSTTPTGAQPTTPETTSLEKRYVFSRKEIGF